MKRSNTFTKCAEQATDLISWLRSKTFVLGILRDIQVAMNATKPIAERHVLTVICAVLTRWMSHFLAMRQLMELRATLTIMADQELDCPEAQWQIITGDTRSKKKAERMLKLIKNPIFWYQNEMYYLFVLSEGGCHVY